MKFATLNNGIKMPYVGLGVYRLFNAEDANKTVRTALDVGYRHIDTATIYKNEDGVGDAIRDSGIAREDIFLTTKLWNDDIRNNTVIKGFEDSLRRLKTDYVDLYLIHWPVPGRYVSVWSEMEEIYKSGRAKAVGVCNYQPHHLKEILAMRSLTPMVNQFEIHPYMVQDELVNLCHDNNIQPEAYSPLGAKKNDLMDNPLILELSKKYDKTPAQIMLRWSIERDIVVIPKSSNKDRQLQNLNVFDFTLSPEDVELIKTLNKGVRIGFDPDNFDF